MGCDESDDAESVAEDAESRFAVKASSNWLFILSIEGGPFVEGALPTSDSPLDSTPVGSKCAAGGVGAELNRMSSFFHQAKSASCGIPPPDRHPVNSTKGERNRQVRNNKLTLFFSRIELRLYVVTQTYFSRSHGLSFM